MKQQCCVHSQIQHAVPLALISGTAVERVSVHSGSASKQSAKPWAMQISTERRVA